MATVAIGAIMIMLYGHAVKLICKRTARNRIKSGKGAFLSEKYQSWVRDL